MDRPKCTARVGSKSKASQATSLAGIETKVGARTSTLSWTACSARAIASSTSLTWCAGTGLHITTVILSSDSAGSSQSSLRTRTWGLGHALTPTASSPCQCTSAPKSPSARLSTPRCLSVTILTVSSSTTERLGECYVKHNNIMFQCGSEYKWDEFCFQVQYMPGKTPLVGWLKGYMVPELMGIQVFSLKCWHTRGLIYRF